MGCLELALDADKVVTMIEPEHSYAKGYAQGMADAGARLIGVVANHLGTTDPDHPLIHRMTVVLGQLAGDTRYDEPSS